MRSAAVRGVSDMPKRALTFRSAFAYITSISRSITSVKHKNPEFSSS